MRDFDWFVTTVGYAGQLRCLLDAEWPTEITVMPPVCEFTEIYGLAAVEPGATGLWTSRSRRARMCGSS
ncbi:MAG: hypothetical protein IPH09_16330 [bacterium]|nr:hypothetical protein [bacterium]